MMTPEILNEKNLLLDQFNNNFLINRGFSVKELNYSSDWSSLMQIVDKIENCDEVENFQINYDATFGIQSVTVLPAYKNTFSQIYTEEDYLMKLKAVWLACIQFVEWYNTYKKEF